MSEAGYWKVGHALTVRRALRREGYPVAAIVASELALRDNGHTDCPG
jgi:hypothetical protein